MSIDRKKHSAGHRARVRERFLDAPHKLPDYELLEQHLGYVIRRRDTKLLAKELLERFGNLAGVLDARKSELLDVPGIGPAVVTYFLQIRELAARYLTQEIHYEKRAVSLDDIGQLARSRLAGCMHEEVWAALLDNGNRLLIFTKVSTGSVDNVPLPTREIVQMVLDNHATGIILVHNHPGGSSRHSSLDLERTKEVVAALTGVRARLLDHLILADGKYYSLTRDHLLA